MGMRVVYLLSDLIQWHWVHYPYPRFKRGGDVMTNHKHGLDALRRPRKISKFFSPFSFRPPLQVHNEVHNEVDERWKTRLSLLGT